MIRRHDTYEGVRQSRAKKTFYRNLLDPFQQEYSNINKDKIMRKATVFLQQNMEDNSDQIARDNIKANGTIC